MFESSPQSKCAISYLIKRPDGETVCLIIVFSVVTGAVLRLLRCESEVT
jgi:hypothetical protein